MFFREFLKWLAAFAAFVLFLMVAGFLAEHAMAKPPQKSKFYNFSEQLIDGEIRKPTTLYTNARERAKFERLLRLKKSFLRQMFETSKHKVFK